MAYNANGQKMEVSPYFRDRDGNVTITPKDSLGINSPTLVENLDPGLYKIEMNYEEGTTQQTVIYKQE